jgi:hypothetical protein
VLLALKGKVYSRYFILFAGLKRGGAAVVKSGQIERVAESLFNVINTCLIDEANLFFG